MKEKQRWKILFLLFRKIGVGRKTNNNKNNKSRKLWLLIWTWKVKIKVSFLFKNKERAREEKVKKQETRRVSKKTNLKVTPLIEGVGWAKDRDLPLKHVVLVDKFDAESLDWFLLETFVLEGERPERAARRLRHRLCPIDPHSPGQSDKPNQSIRDFKPTQYAEARRRSAVLFATKQRTFENDPSSVQLTVSLAEQQLELEHSPTTHRTNTKQLTRTCVPFLRQRWLVPRTCHVATSLSCFGNTAYVNAQSQHHLRDVHEQISPFTYYFLFNVCK